MEPDLVFQKALEIFKKDLTLQQRRDFGVTTLQDVKDEVNKIQIQHGSAKKLRGMSRMSKFLEAMHEVVAFIWVASSRLEILECLLDTFTDITEAMPDLQGYVSIFKDQPEVLEVLKRCYGDIIQFFHMAFGVLGRPGAFGIRDWRRIFDSVWKTFRTKFSPVLGSLRRHRELLVQVKLTATYGAVETTRHALQESIEKSNEELKQILNAIEQKKKQIVDRLGGPGPHSDKAHRRLPDQRYPTSGDWILQEQDFLQWLDPNNSSNDLIYLNGMPGAGKTTLVSRIIDGMTEERNAQQRPLLNFYYEQNQTGKIHVTDMLRSFIEQLLQQDDDIVDDLHETVLPARPSDLSSVSWLEDVVNRIILAQKRCFIVIDGVDECALDQRKRILQWIKTVLSEAKVSNVVVKILVSGQRDGVVDAMLQDCACTIKLDNQAPHFRDIENFSSSVLAQIKDRFPGLEDEEYILNRLDASCIAEASKGMFMYAKVVLDNFLSQTSIYELEQEVGREYPSGLDEAYDRVAERVLDKTSDSRKRAALQILGLVACAARPLKWREMQCYFCTDAVNGTCDPRRRKVGGPKDLCSSFIESEACTMFPDIPSEAQVTMVHNTAKSYLLRSGRLDMAQQHMQMSLFCFQYLTASAFDAVRQDSNTVGAAHLTGFYGFFDYAAAHWDHHSLECVRQTSLTKATLSTEEGLGKLLSMAWVGFVKRFSVGNVTLRKARSDHEVPLDTSKSQFVIPDAVDTERESYNIQEIFSDWRSTRRSTEFESLAVSLRQITQQTDLRTLKDREKAVHLSLNGVFRPKCSRRACVHFSKGFESEAELALHIKWHEMAFKCPHVECYAWLAGFPTGASLQIHLKRVHQAIDSEERLFPIKRRKRPRTLEEACRLGDIELVRSFYAPITTSAEMLGANRALSSTARAGHSAICVYLTQLGANPYKIEPENSFASEKSAIQVSIRLGDLDLFSALRGAAQKHQEMAFIEEESTFVECILDALESPIPQFFVDVLAWNYCRIKPLTLHDILWRASMEAWRQEYGCPTLSSIKRQVLIERSSVQERLQILISRELERFRSYALFTEIAHEVVLVAPSNAVGAETLLHRLCGGDEEHASVEAVRFLLTKLRPEDIRRHDSKGNPPLFTAIENKFRLKGTSLDRQADIIRSFFAHNLHEARRTRNAAGLSPLEFACKHGPVKTFPTVFELCGADFNAFGLDSSDKRIRMALRLTPGEMHSFIGLLTDLGSEPGVVKMLKFLVLHVNLNRMSAEPDIDIPKLSDILQSVDPAPTRFLSSLKEADRMLERYRPEIEVLAPAHLRRLFFISLEARETRYDIAKILLIQHKLELQSTGPGENWLVVAELIVRRDMDPEVVSLLKRYGGYWDLSSTETRDRVIETLSHYIYASEKAQGQYLDGLRDYVNSFVHYADSEKYQDFAVSLSNFRRHFR